MKDKILDIPLYMQGTETAWCVPYSLVGVAEYYGIKATKQGMIEAVNASKKTGTKTEDYTRGIQEFGLKFKRLKFKYKEIRKTLREGTPIALSYSSSKDESHFTILVGARRDSRGIRFYTLNDTFYGRYEIPASVLEYLMYLNDNSWARKVVLA